MNKKLLTLEDANSIISHFGRGFCDYYTLDTSLLSEATWFAYDFIDVIRSTNSISFEIKNDLWTGGYKILDCNIEDYTVDYTGKFLIVSGTGLTSLKLVLELSPEFKYDTVFELDYNPEYTPVIRPFYEQVALTMGFLDGDAPVTGLTVTDKITGDSLTTDNDGLVTILSNADKAGDYDYILEAENNGVIVDYNFPYQRIHAELPIVLLNNDVYRDKVNILRFQFLFDDEYSITESMLFNDNLIRLRVDGVYYTVKEYMGSVFSFEVPVSLTNYLNMRLEIGGNDYLEDYTVDLNVETSYLTVSSTTDLQSELSSDSPAGTILYTGNSFDNSVTVSESVNIIFRDNIVSMLDNVFTVTDGAVLTLTDCSFTGKTLITLEDGSVSVLNSDFTHSTAPLFKGVGDLTIKDSSFIDNYTCIDLDGDVDLYNTLFDLSDNTYLDTSTPAFIQCYGVLSFDFCQFNIDLHNLTILGLSYVMFLLGANGSVNGVSNNHLLENEVFPIKRNTGEAVIESEHYRITGKSNKCMIWTVQGTNTVYSNELTIE